MHYPLRYGLDSPKDGRDPAMGSASLLAHITLPPDRNQLGIFPTSVYFRFSDRWHKDSGRSPGLPANPFRQYSPTQPVEPLETLRV